MWTSRKTAARGEDTAVGNNGPDGTFGALYRGGGKGKLATRQPPIVSASLCRPTTWTGRQR